MSAPFFLVHPLKVTRRLVTRPPRAAPISRPLHPVRPETPVQKEKPKDEGSFRMTFKQFTRFTSDAGGLEKILRFLQSVAQILTALAVTVDDRVYWMFLRKQFALGRRFLRFFKFIVCFEKAYAAFTSQFELTLGGMLQVGKWTAMGCYLFLESITILDAIGTHPTPLAEICMHEANKFWFYSLICSLALGFIELSSNRRELVRLGENKIKIKLAGKKGVKRRLVSDCADLLIPGHVVGWITSTPVVVGFSSVVSTVLGSVDIWEGLK